MRFKLALQATGTGSSMPANYQYPLSAAIYKIIERADGEYAAFLHDKGYRLTNGKSFKLFSFSDLKAPYIIKEDRFFLQKNSPASLTIGFHIDQAASNFVKGLFIHQQFDIADRKSGSRFTVQEVQLLPDPLPADKDEPLEIVLQPLSALVVGRKNERGNYDFLSPADEGFAAILCSNWIEKFRAAHGPGNTEELDKKVEIQLATPPQQIKSRLMTIKAFTPQQTKIRGFHNFRLRVKAPKPMLELALNAGMGLYNAMGCGCVGVAC